MHLEGRGMQAILNLLAMLVAQISIPIPGVPSLPIPIPNSIPIPPLQHDVPSIDATSGRALVQIPELDGFNPHGYNRLADVPKGPDGFDIGPGAFEMLDLSFCLNVGLHAPSDIGGYYVAPLSGSRADIVRTVLNRWNTHPEIAQRDVQLLLWAITSKAHVDTGSSGAGRAAQALLTPGEISNLNGGSLAVFSNLLSRLGSAVPAPLQQILNAQNQVRDLLEHGNSSYQQIARIAAPAGGTPTGVRLRWSYDPAGYFIRYLTHSYSQTTIQIYMPHVYSVQRDSQGRITSIADDAHERLDVAYSGATPSIRFHRPVGQEHVGDRSFPIRVAAGTSLTNASAVAAALQSASAALRAYDKSTVLAFAQDFSVAGICKAHGGCASGDPPYDPTSKDGVSPDGAHQPSGQSGKPAPDDKKKDCDKVRKFIQDAEHFRDEYNDPGLVAEAKKNHWTGQQFEDAVRAKDQADAKASGAPPGTAGAMTYFDDCTIQPPNESDLKKKGFTQAEIDAMWTHEITHKLDCQKAKQNGTPDTWQWRQKTENDAYNAEIKQLQQWLAANC
jgi:hypothetical protein